VKLKIFLERLFISVTILVIGLGVFIFGCWLHYADTVQFGDDWLDSPLTHDSALTDANALLSTRIGSPTTDQLSQPVCVLVHGFSASSFEFEAFVDTVSTQRPDVLFSQVVMGGHGRDYEAFKQATYQIGCSLSLMKSINYRI